MHYASIVPSNPSDYRPKSPVYVHTKQCYFTCDFLRATAGTAIARLSHRNSVRLSVRLSVRHTGGSGKNGAS